jgi:acyl dehydratase
MTNDSLERPESAAWARMSEHMMSGSEQMVRSVFEANRAMLTAFGGATANGNGEETTDGAYTERHADREELPIDSVSYGEVDWEFERSVERRADLTVGDWVTFEKDLTDAEVREFARISGDTNRLHLDDGFAGQSRFGGRIVHGTFVSSLISAALARLPGLTIYLSQDLAFLGPVDIGERLRAHCEIIEDLGESRFRLSTIVETTDEETVIEGEAVVLIDEFPEE